MSRLSFSISVLALLFGVSPASAGPITITDTFDWTGRSSFADSAAPQWTHTLNFVPEADSIVSATLDLRHAGNNLLVEAWSLSSQSNTAIGGLGLSWFLIDFVTTQSFDLPSSLFPSFPASNWSVGLKLTESTSGSDFISLDWARLSVTYEPVAATQTPEPATLTLIGTGVAAALWRRRRQPRRQIA
jgi:hypothetical protein